MARRPVSEDAMLDKMSIDELVQLRSNIDALVTHKRTDGRKRLMETMSEEAKKQGFDINELFGSAGKRKQGGKGGKGQTDVKYRHPKDPSLTWSGRGRPSRWLTDLIAEGHKRDEFAV